MNTQFANITETRTKMPILTKQALNGDVVILLKNGKPLLGLLDYNEILEYQSWKQEQAKKIQFEEWKNALESEKITQKQEQEILDSQSEINSGKFINLKSDDSRLSSEILGINK